MGTRITIIRNPAGDTEFEQAVDEFVREGIQDPNVAQARLRERYPNSVIRPRELTGEWPRAWYVYREGRWIPTD